MRHDVIGFGEEERDISGKNISEDETVRECNAQDDEDETTYTRYSADSGIEESEDDEVFGTMTDKNDNHKDGQNIIEGEVSDNDVSQGADPSNTSIPSEEDK